MLEKVHKAVLPALKEGAHNKVSNFKTAGTWDSRLPSELDNISESLRVDKIDPSYFEIDSIPDMWARPLLFEMALFDPYHLLHSRIRGEWRGLLALLALREMRGIGGLTVEAVHIPAPDSTESATEFIAALSKLLPSSMISVDTSWSNLYVFLLDGRVIAVTSPSTLVCTPVDYAGKLTGLPWFNGKILEDPGQHLSGRECLALAAWLDNLKKALVQHGGIKGDSKQFEALLGLIGDHERGFIRDLSTQPPGVVSLSKAGLDMTQGVFRYLAKAVKGQEDGTSHVRLLPSTASYPQKSLLVIDPGVADQWGLEDKDIVVWGALTLNSLPFGGLTGPRNQIRNKILEGAEWRKPQDFFNARLFVVGQTDVFPGAIKISGSDGLTCLGQPVSPIPPLSSELLEHLSAEDIAGAISFEQLSDRVRVRLHLILAGAEGTGRPFELKKDYSEKEITVLSNVPVLEVWPNFKAPGWRAYFTYFSPAGQSMTFYAKPHIIGAARGIHRFERGGQLDLEITATDSLPEAMECSAQSGDSSNAKELGPAGILLLKPPDPVPPPFNPLAVGVDFGTSGTNVYTRDQRNEPVGVEFENRFLMVTKSGARRARLYDDFLPGEREETPFLSIFHDFKGDKTATGLRPLLDGHIYFVSEYRNIFLGSSKVVTDLKWGGTEDRVRTHAFLSQLCLQCAAEAVFKGASRIDWRFSFPTAFSRAERQHFESIWHLICRECTEQTGITQPEDGPTYKSESLAAAHFFANPPVRRITAPLQRGSVFIDIGGATSDISVWQDNELKLQTSLRLAGRDLLLSPLRSNPDFLSVFNVDTTVLNRLKGNTSSFYVQAEAILGREGGAWLDALPSRGSEPTVQDFVRILSLGISGIFFYIGLVLRYLNETGVFEPRLPNIYAGGNGCRLLHWIAGGAYRESSHINSLLKRAVLESSGFDSGEFEVHMSPFPKAEVAYGLLQDDTPLREGNNAIRDDVIAGEYFLEGGRRCSWGDSLTPERLKSGLQLEDKLTNFDKFLETFNSEANDLGFPPIPRTSTLSAKVHERLAQLLANLAGSEVDSIRVEPLFINALKKLLELEADEWAIRYTPARHS